MFNDFCFPAGACAPIDEYKRLNSANPPAILTSSIIYTLECLKRFLSTMYLGLLTIVDDYRHVPGRAMLFDNWHEGQLRNNKRMRLLWLLVWLACMGVLIQQVSLTGPREV